MFSLGSLVCSFRESGMFSLGVSYVLPGILIRSLWESHMFSLGSRVCSFRESGMFSLGVSYVFPGESRVFF